MTPTAAANFRLLFRSLFDEGRGYAFDCDALGQVDLDTLTVCARDNYSYARATVGRDFASPIVESGGVGAQTECHGRG